MMKHKSNIKTMSDWKEEWGIERYVKALGRLSKFLLDHSHPISKEDIETLKQESQDVFELFGSYMFHGLG